MYLEAKEEEVKRTKEAMQSIYKLIYALHRRERRRGQANKRRYDKYLCYQIIYLEEKEEEVKTTKATMQSMSMNMFIA